MRYLKVNRGPNRAQRRASRKAEEAEIKRERQIATLDPSYAKFLTEFQERCEHEDADMDALTTEVEEAREAAERRLIKKGLLKKVYPRK
jgi:hypothetical protein